MVIPRPSFYEAISLLLTLTFGLIGVLGTIQIAVTPAVSNIIAIGTIVSTVLAFVAFQVYKYFRNSQIHRFRIVDETYKLSFKPSQSTSQADRISPIGHVHRSRTLKALHSHIKNIHIDQMITDKTRKDPDQVLADCNYECVLESKAFGVSTPNISANISELRPLRVEVNFPTSLSKGDKVTVSEKSILPNQFDMNEEFYVFRMMTPTKSKRIRVDFEGIKVTSAWYEVRHGRGQKVSKTLNINSNEAGSPSEHRCYIEHKWKSPRIGEDLHIRWTWDLNT